MSNTVHALCKHRKVGSLTRKAVLLLLADFASDDGTGIWASKANMAADLEMSETALRDAIRWLSGESIVREVGQRKHQNGFTVEYAIDLGRVCDLPITRENAPVLTPTPAAPLRQAHPTPTPAAAQDLRQPQVNHPLTTIEPSEETLCIPQGQFFPDPEKPPPKARLPDDWALSDEGWAYARSQAIPDEVIEDEARGFHAYWTDRTDRESRKSQRGWEQCWASWCRRIAGRYRKAPSVSRQPYPQGGGRGSSLASIAARRRAEGAV